MQPELVLLTLHVRVRIDLPPLEMGEVLAAHPSVRFVWRCEPSLCEVPLAQVVCCGLTAHLGGHPPGL